MAWRVGILMPQDHRSAATLYLAHSAQIFAAHVAWPMCLCCQQSRSSGAHLDEQWRQSFAAKLLVHTQEVDLHHALGVAPYTDGCWHSCTANKDTVPCLQASRYRKHQRLSKHQEAMRAGPECDSSGAPSHV